MIDFRNPRSKLYVGIAGIGLIIFINVIYLFSGATPGHQTRPAAAQQDRDFLLALYDLTRTDMTDPARVAAVLKTQFTGKQTEGEDPDPECAGGKRETDVEVYTPSKDFWRRWSVERPHDALLDIGSGIAGSEREDPQFAYVVTRPKPCAGTYAGPPAAWGIARFVTAPAFGCATAAELERGFPRFSRDAATADGGRATYRSIQSQGRDRGTVLIAGDNSQACFGTVSVAGGQIWGETYLSLEHRYLQCAESARTLFAQASPEPGDDAGRTRWTATLRAGIHDKCGGEPYFPDLQAP